MKTKLCNWIQYLPDSFLPLLGLVILFAYWTPIEWVSASTNSLHHISYFGVLGIFFMYGIGMSLRQLREGLANWPLHFTIHGATFGLFPMLVLLPYFLFKTPETESFWIGIFYVSVLPSTVSSSIVMVSIARGNFPAAIFDASISSLLGVFLTPLWMCVILSSAEMHVDLRAAIQSLVVMVVLPVGLGMLLNSRLGNLVLKKRPIIRYFDQSVVLLIVYNSFSDSFASNAFEGISVMSLLVLAVGMATLFSTVFLLIRCWCRILRFTREDTIAALFCGSKKSLMHGTAMSGILFAGIASKQLGMILLPIMLYHAIQLVIISILASRAGNRAVQ
ncbi:MAG: bile acid:sodium symporter family protein [Thermoguttaceae bacterium]